VDVLWSPWRYDYITGGTAEKSGCVFCRILENSASDEENYILHRAEFNFVILNIYPYGTGHLMVIPYSHIADLSMADMRTTAEMMELTKTAQRALAETYEADGFNIGMNLGKAAGAGVADHYHMHVLPRWIGDVNFLTSIGQTRNVPEPLNATYQKLKGKFSSDG
jgi:ATP adenylyltransferase